MEQRIWKKLTGKGKVTLDKKDFRAFLWTMVNRISEEWKDVNDKRIKELEENNKELRKALSKQVERYNKYLDRSNNLISSMNLLIVTLNTRIENLKMQLEAKENGK